jgi:hypothetical protein
MLLNPAGARFDGAGWRCVSVRPRLVIGLIDAEMMRNIKVFFEAGILGDGDGDLGDVSRSVWKA